MSNISKLQQAEIREKNRGLARTDLIEKFRQEAKRARREAKAMPADRKNYNADYWTETAYLYEAFAADLENGR